MHASNSTDNTPIHLWLGSTNRAKVAAAEAAVLSVSSGIVTGVSVTSGVAEQPMSDEETRAGATGRARAALIHGQQQKIGGLLLGMGLEGGVVEQSDGLWNTVWAVVVDEQGDVFAANGSRFRIPERIAQSIRDGREMGPLLAEITGVDDIRSKGGFIGAITESWVTRTQEYTNLATLALGLWHGRRWQAAMEKLS